MANTMKASVLEKKKTLILKDIPVPKYNDDEVLVKIEEVGLCGSDLHFYNDGRIGDFIAKDPFILGHEGSGIVMEVGKNVKDLKPGDRVSIEPNVPCFKCDFCKTGNYSQCNNIVALSAPPYDGLFTEYINYEPSFLFKVSNDISFTEVALAEPLSVGYSCASRAEVKAGDYVCILGFGPIGLSCIEIVKAMGASRIFVTDINDYRLNIAKKHGAYKTINVARDDLGKNIFENTDGLGVDSVIEVSCNEESIINSLNIVRKGGKVVWAGLGKDNITIPYGNCIFKDISIEMVFRYKNTYKPVVRLLESKLINFEDFVTHRFKLDEIQKAFDTANNPSIDQMKIIIEI